MNLEERMSVLTECFNKSIVSGRAKNRKQFAEIIGVSQTTISCAFAGDDRYLTDSLISKAVSATDQLELDYAFPGIATSKPKERVTTLPVIPTEAMAGSLGDFATQVKEYDCERMVSPILGADYAMKVCGDSMSPEYPNGSQILIKKINEKAFVEWGKVYVLDTENGAVIKQIRKTEKEGIVECVSLNPLYQPFTIDTTYINGWYRVLMVLSLK